MSSLIFTGMLDAMMQRAASHGPLGVAFCLPICPVELAGDVTETMYMFHGSANEYAQHGSRILSIYAGLAAEGAARASGRRARVSVW